MWSCQNVARSTTLWLVDNFHVLRFDWWRVCAYKFSTFWLVGSLYVQVLYALIGWELVRTTLWLVESLHVLRSNWWKACIYYAVHQSEDSRAWCNLARSRQRLGLCLLNTISKLKTIRLIKINNAFKVFGRVIKLLNL